jgi:hypothetical protein
MFGWKVIGIGIEKNKCTINLMDIGWYLIGIVITNLVGGKQTAEAITGVQEDGNNK